MLSTLTTNIPPITNSWQSLSQDARELLAYCLSKDNPQLSVLASDATAQSLLATGWVVERAGKIPGIQCLEITADGWTLLKSNKHEFLTPTVIASVNAKRACNTGSYPKFW